jgi:hypothetical protein
MRVQWQIVDDSVILCSNDSKVSRKALFFWQGRVRLGLWCLMPLSTIFQIYCGGHFFFGGVNQSTQRNHRPVASHWQLWHIMLYRVHLIMNWVRTHKFSGDKHRYCETCINHIAVFIKFNILSQYEHLYCIFQCIFV